MHSHKYVVFNDLSILFILGRKHWHLEGIKD
jgi:hypothetical protein